MVDAEPNDRIEEYRKTAATLRLLAHQMSSPGAKDRMLLLADNFERLADRAAAWDASAPKRNPGDR